MPHGPLRRATLTLVIVATLATACGVGGTDRSGAPTGATAATVPPSVTATVTAGATAPPPASTSAGPPAASLAAEGGDPVAGQLGSYTWLEAGSDSPWLQGTPVSVGAREPLTITIGDGVAVADWSARRVQSGIADGTGAVGLGYGGPPVTFAAPGPGTWSVQVTVRFAGDVGSATYYWQLAVR